MKYHLEQSDLAPTKSFVLIFLFALLGGCSNLVQHATPQSYSAEITHLLSGQILGYQINTEELPNIDLLAITPEMASFAEQAVARKADTFDKVKALHTALLLPTNEGGRGITYSAFTTEAPIKTFSERKANCLSFTLLYVALARHLGISAYVNEVIVPPTWDMRESGQLYYMQHVNVKVPLRNYINRGYISLTPDEAIIDLDMSRYKPTYPQKTISDELTAAKFYSNRGMEFASEEKPREAFLYLRKALQNNDQQSYIWNNFASLYRRMNLLHETEIMYLHGLTLDPGDLTIMNNLSGIYYKMGSKKQAAIYHKMAKRYRQANPYYQYILAHSAYDNGDYVKALSYVKRAIDREKKEPRFYQLTASIYEHLGQPHEVEAMTKKYKDLLVQER